MDTNELGMETAEIAEEVKPLGRKWYILLYIVMIAVALSLNFLMVVFALRGIDNATPYPYLFLWIMLPMLNAMYFSAFEWLGKRLGFNLLAPLLTAFSICVVSLAVPYLIVAL